MENREEPMKALAYLVYLVGYWACFLIMQQVVVFSAFRLGLNPDPWGLVVALFIAGVILGAFLGRRYRRPIGRREKWMLCGLVILSMFMLLLGLSLFSERYDLIGSLEGDATTLFMSAILILFILWIPLTLSLGLGVRLALGTARKKAEPDQTPGE